LEPKFTSESLIDQRTAGMTLAKSTRTRSLITRNNLSVILPKRVTE